MPANSVKNYVCILIEKIQYILGVTKFKIQGETPDPDKKGCG